MGNGGHSGVFPWEVGGHSGGSSWEVGVIMGISSGKWGFSCGKRGFHGKVGFSQWGGGGGGDFLLGNWGCVWAFCVRGGWLGFPQGSGGCGFSPMRSGGVVVGFSCRKWIFPPSITLFSSPKMLLWCFPCETGYHGIIPKEAGVVLVVGFP